MTQEAWEALQYSFRNTFRYSDPEGNLIDFSDIKKLDQIYLYGRMEKLVADFERELENNFLEIKRNTAASAYLLERVSIVRQHMEEISSSIRSKAKQDESTHRDEIIKNERIIALLKAQYDALFAFMFSVRAKRLYKDVLKSVSFALENELETEINSAKKSINKLTTFNSTTTEAQLKGLYTGLNKNFIACSYATFKKVFKGAEAKELKEPVKWIDLSKKNKTSPTNASTLFDLLYLLKFASLLPASDFDSTSKNTNNLYRKIEICFADSLGNPILNLRTKNKFAFTGKTERSKELKVIVESILEEQHL